MDAGSGDTSSSAAAREPADQTPAQQSVIDDSSAAAVGSRQHPTYAADSRVTRQDVIDWTSRGVREDLILDRIARSGTVFHLTAAEENQLRDAGVSESVIQEMRLTARR